MAAVRPGPRAAGTHGRGRRTRTMVSGPLRPLPRLLALGLGLALLGAVAGERVPGTPGAGPGLRGRPGGASRRGSRSRHWGPRERGRSGRY